jgi:hypothetical protein
MPTDDGPVDVKVSPKDEPRQEQRKSIKHESVMVNQADLDKGCEDIEAADTLKELQAVWVNLKPEVAKHADAFNAKEKRKRELQLADTADKIANPAADLAGDSIPH